MAGESPEKSEQQKSSGETTRGEGDPRLSVIQDSPDRPAEAADDTSETTEPPAGKAVGGTAGAAEADGGPDAGSAADGDAGADADAAAGPDAGNDADANAGTGKDGGSDEGADADEPAGADAPAGNDKGDARLRAAVAAWVAGTDADAEAAVGSDSEDAADSGNSEGSNGSEGGTPSGADAGTAEDGADSDLPKRPAAGHGAQSAADGDADGEADGADASAAGRAGRSGTGKGKAGRSKAEKGRNGVTPGGDAASGASGKSDGPGSPEGSGKPQDAGKSQDTGKPGDGDGAAAVDQPTTMFKAPRAVTGDRTSGADGSTTDRKAAGGKPRKAAGKKRSVAGDKPAGGAAADAGAGGSSDEEPKDRTKAARDDVTEDRATATFGTLGKDRKKPARGASAAGAAATGAASDAADRAEAGDQPSGKDAGEAAGKGGTEPAGKSEAKAGGKGGDASSAKAEGRDRKPSWAKGDDGDDESGGAAAGGSPDDAPAGNGKTGGKAGGKTGGKTGEKADDDGTAVDQPTTAFTVTRPAGRKADAGSTSGAGQKSGAAAGTGAGAKGKPGTEGEPGSDAKPGDAKKSADGKKSDGGEKPGTDGKAGTRAEAGAKPDGEPGTKADGKAGAKPDAEPAEKKGVDQPTTAFKALKPGAKPESDSERTSRFVPLKDSDTAPRKPKSPVKTADEPAVPAQSTAAPSLSEAERTKQQPLPPEPAPGEPAPIDLLAQLTNTPPPPETPVRTIVRRFKIWTPLAILLAVVFATVQALRPLPEPTLDLTAQESYAFDGKKPTMPWPAKGQAAVGIDGLGSFGTFGEQKPVPIASVAKTMTAYVILKEHPLKPGKQGARIPVDKKAEDDAGLSAQNESVVDTKEGEKLTECEALNAIMIASANNVARLLARWDAGSEQAFVKKMNAAAKDLGMKNTTYTDPSGLQATTVSTAEDQVKLGRKAMQDPVFREVVGKPSYMDRNGKKQDNWNRLVPFSGVGIKTGTSTAAQGNLLFAARKQVGGTNQLIIGAVLNQPPSPTDNSILTGAVDASKALITAAGDTLTTRKVVKKGDVVGRVDDGLGGTTPVVATKDVTAVGWAGLTVDIELTDNGKVVPHTAKAGTEVGTMTVGSGLGQVQVPIALQDDLAEPGFGSKLTRIT
ncbi:D-alanyl-D-alanine carboxypeptidase [Streptomyces sp. NPDC001922]|uniref:D-alanyl-D-alanine carboxypeptidase n=1 Tax=Streptomyces sp. NPDC001922 TaxID=3364624 RepID=UPI0036BD5C1C